MITSFRFYRRRLLLPFLAAYALVCINGATLAPIAPLPSFTAADGEIAPDPPLTADPWRQLHYDRGEPSPPQPVMAAGPPPIVKNLRRAPPSWATRDSARVRNARPSDAPRPPHEFRQRALTANAADLSRLCRLLL